MTGLEVFLGTVVPILGGLIAVVMYCSPLKAVYTAKQQQNLGDLNPLPFAVTFISTACWNAYGLAAPDYNMFLPNIPGLTAALYNSITCYGVANRQVQNLILSIICGASCVILVLGAVTRFACSAQQGKLLWGIMCNIITIAYYGAPLSSAVQVVRSRNSASIYLPTCIANLANASLWVAYGFAVGDLFIWLPNGIGGMFAILLILLCLLYPKHPLQKGGTKLGTAEKPTGSSEGLLDQHKMEEGVSNGTQPVEGVVLPVAHVEVVTSNSALKTAGSRPSLRRTLS